MKSRHDKETPFENNNCTSDCILLQV